METYIKGDGMLKKLRKYLRFLIPYEMIIFTDINKAVSFRNELLGLGYIAYIKACDCKIVLRYK